MKNPNTPSNTAKNTTPNQLSSTNNLIPKVTIVQYQREREAFANTIPSKLPDMHSSNVISQEEDAMNFANIL